MKELLDALSIIRKYNLISLNDVVLEFSKHSNQVIPQDCIDEFKFTGLNNIDFLRSDWLNQYKLMNLYQFNDDEIRNDWMK